MPRIALSLYEFSRRYQSATKPWYPRARPSRHLIMLEKLAPSPPRGEGWGEGPISRKRRYFACFRSVHRMPQPPRKIVPLTLTLSPEGRGNASHSSGALRVLAALSQRH
jgi:hypothetical protein